MSDWTTAATQRWQHIPADIQRYIAAQVITISLSQPAF
jgi:hypothetical protein